MTAQECRKLLEQERARLRERLGDARWSAYGGRIAVVLSGGGARGGYEAGVLLAFQDARLPTHILTASSIGSVNAASYAAHSDGYVGDARPLVESWLEVTPAAVGVDWTRYILILGGLVAAVAGLLNFGAQALREVEIYLHLHHPKLTWAALALAGVSIILLYDQLPYIGYVALNAIRRHRWKPDRRKLALSLVANFFVWGFVYAFVELADVHFPREVIELGPVVMLAALTAAIALAYGSWRGRDRLSRWSRQFLRLPLKSGLFPNFERTRFLRDRIPVGRLRASPIRVLMTAADVRTGEEVFFSNTSRAALESDPGADADFVRGQVVPADDLLRAVMASSAFPLVYEVVEIGERHCMDGGVVGNQPIRPAVRLGAEVLFLVLVEPAPGKRVRRPPLTFLDSGTRAIEILMAQNLRGDLRILQNMNDTCERYAAELGVAPEQVILEVGSRRYRYVKPFVVCPAEPLHATVLDFHRKIIAPAIVQGYRDGAAAVLQFRDYIAPLPATAPKHLLRLVAERPFAKAVSTTEPRA